MSEEEEERERVKGRKKDVRMSKENGKEVTNVVEEIVVDNSKSKRTKGDVLILELLMVQCGWNIFRISMCVPQKQTSKNA